ncbi:MAG: glycosyltransferase [Hyphomicrobiales bacterium]|nr:glycosyltransferase [Hyphomicrobiales bacterium]MDE2115537.1 glycosyltransferase [Hyphomicrobiales bacterium]
MSSHIVARKIVAPLPLPPGQEAAPLDGAAGQALVDEQISHMVAALKETSRQMREVYPFSRQPEAQRVSAGHTAVLLPCHNEAASIVRTIEGFRAAMPTARIVVFDNASSDNTAELARGAGAEVFFEPRKGKGHVVRRMFADIDAEIYIIADGDGTYDASAAPQLVDLVANGGVDMAIGARANVHQEAHRSGHAFGNRLFNRLYGALFGMDYVDIFSGYRAFSRRFVKSFPALSSGFEIETELCVHASQLMLATQEINLPYGKRQSGSHSKLRTFRDGWRILSTFAFLLKETRPALFFGGFAALFAAASIGLALPLINTWLATGLVPRLPTAIVCTGLIMMAGMSAVCGLILDSLARSRTEQKRMLYLALADRRR